jgi:cation diffusion facilitator family transporter
MTGMQKHRREHSHAFGQDIKRPGETRTILVIVITSTMMVVEIVAGLVFGSMALLADGLHMASHAVALSINALAYIYARRHAHNASFSFGTGKINTLGGYTGAVLLAGFALIMAVESINRLVSPVPIEFNQAIIVAVLGLIVNGVSVLILGHHDHGHDDGDGHGHGHDHERDHDHDHDEGPALARDHHHHDHNLISAYLHVLADALTSLLAIFALLAAKYFGFIWADPLMGIVGAILVARWSYGLLHSTSVVLLDRQGPDDIRETIQRRIEHDGGNRVVDLHLWAIGPKMYSAIISIVANEPRDPDHYKALIPDGLGIVHTIVEVHVAD